jgi:copper chaperone CopZ
MKKRPGPKTRTLLAATAALGLGLAVVACSGEGEAGSASAADASPARLATAEFDIDGMTCGGCALATEMAVKKLEGVESADADYDEAADEGRCTVEYDPSTVDTDRIAAAIRDAGFEPRLREKGSG